MLRNKKATIRILKVMFFVFCFFYLSSVVCRLSFTQEQFVYDAKGKRDPFIPLVTPEGRLISLDTEQTKKALNLEGIIYDANGISYAIINGAVVRIGDMVDDNQVLKIESNKVIFIKEGNPFELELKEDEGEKIKETGS